MVGVSIGLPVRNGEAFLEETLYSLLAQVYEDFEVVIADNASDDRTLEIARAFAAADPRVKVFSHPTNLGAAANYNFVFTHSEGKFFKWTGHDDTYAPQFLQRCINELEELGEDVVLVHTGTRLIDYQSAELAINDERVEALASQPSERMRYIIRNVYSANAIFGLMRRDALEDTRLIDRYYASDYILLAELAMLGKIRQVPDVLMSRRVHQEMSHLVNRSVRDLLAWYDPTQTPNWLSTRPGKRLLWEYHKSAARIPKGFQRLLCLASILPVYLERRFRRTGRPVKMSSYLDSRNG